MVGSSQLIHVSVVCNESQVNQEQDGEFSAKGSATENALIYMAISAGVNVTEVTQKYSLLQTNLRSENPNIMSTVHPIHQTSYKSVINGYLEPQMDTD